MDGVVKPRGSLVLVRSLPLAEETTRGGIALPPNVVKTGVTYAVVEDIGPGRYLENGAKAKLDDLKRGDYVILQAGRMMPLKAGDQKLGLINEQDILAVVQR